MRFGNKVCIGLDKQARNDAHAKYVLLTVCEFILDKEQKNLIRFRTKYSPIAIFYQDDVFTKY